MLDQQDVVDEVGLGIVRVNQSLSQLTLDFANFNCTQKTRCSPFVYREVCTRFGIVWPEARDYLIGRLKKRTQHEPFTERVDNPHPPNASGATPIYPMDIQNPSPFLETPLLNEWQICFNAIAYIVRWVSAVDENGMNAPVFQLLSAAANIPLCDALRRNATFLSIEGERVYGMPSKTYGAPAKWVDDIAFCACCGPDCRPDKAGAVFMCDVSTFGKMCHRSDTQSVRDFLEKRPHVNVNTFIRSWQPNAHAPPKEFHWMRPLAHAVITENANLVVLLLQLGADPNARTRWTPNGSYFETALHASLQIERGALGECRRMLLQPNVDIAAMRLDGSTVLHQLMQMLEVHVPRMQHSNNSEGIRLMIDDVASIVECLKELLVTQRGEGAWTQLLRTKARDGETALDRLTAFWTRKVSPLACWNQRVNRLATLLFRAW